jgi:beta-galactosidase
MEIRRDNEQFLKYTRLYLNRLFAEVGHLQATNGGTIIMVQAENEFGSYVAQRKDIPLEEHKTYNAKIAQQLKDAGFNVPTFTSDGSWLFEGGYTPGALPTANGEGNIENLKKVVNQYNNGQGPYMVAEFYPGWLDHWAEPFPLVSASKIARKTAEYLKNDVSFNYYMVHGGTNFGFTTGANYNKDHDIQPDMTSYDYDAPISEAGWVTPKYDSIRNVIKKYVDYKIPAPPKPNPVIEIAPIAMNKIADILAWSTAQPKLQSAQPLTFEQMKQGHGYVLYERSFTQPIKGTMVINGLRDYAVVYVDGVYVGEVNRYFKKYSIDVDIPWNSKLSILVENMGRINYGSEIIHNTKGIISPITINGTEIVDWEMTQMPMSSVPVLDYKENTDVNAQAFAKKPVVYEGTFTLDETGDTFLDMAQWGKGIVFVNGINIGRYWSVGPQQTLYVPGVWLKKGENKVVVFEQQNSTPQTTLKTTKIPVLQEVKLPK